jgi:hypothetical protein
MELDANLHVFQALIHVCLCVFLHLGIGTCSSFLVPQYREWLWVGRLGESLSPSRVKNFHTSSGKQLQHEVIHSPPTSAKVRKMWIYTSTPPCLHRVELS